MEKTVHTWILEFKKNLFPEFTLIIIAAWKMDHIFLAINLIVGKNSFFDEQKPQATL